MRFFELAIGIAVASAAIASVRTARPALVLGVVVSAVLVGTLGAPRWQLLPGAFAVAVLAGTALIQVATDGAPIAPRFVAGTVILGLLVSAALSWALPVPRLELEADSGPIGTTAFDLTDPARRSPSGEAPADQPRTTPVQAWYPTTATRGRTSPVTTDADAFATAVGGFLGLPPFLLKHVGQVRTSAFVDAPVDAPAPLPVIIALHGWGGFRFAQAPLLEQLAADGHLVLALDHTYGAVVAQPVDGPTVPLDPNLLPDGVPQPVYDAAAATLERMFADDALTLIAALRDGSSQLPDDVLAAADLDRVVLLGHSTGGGAAAIVCAEDPICRGLVLYDPWVEPVPAEIRAAGFAAPTTAIVSEEWAAFDNQVLLDEMLAASGEAIGLRLDETKHRDVTIESRLSPLSARLKISGTLGPERTHEIILAVTRAGIARALPSTAGPAVPMNPEFPELHILP